MLFQLSDACGSDPGLICKSVFEATDNEFAARASEWLVDKPLKALFIVLVAWLISRVVRKAINSYSATALARLDAADRATVEEVESGPLSAFAERMADKLDTISTQGERKRQRTQTLAAVLKSIASVTIFIVAGLVALGEFDINLGPLIAGAGIVGVALGFGAQTIVRDFLSGIFMLLEDQYGVGDIIDFGEATGVVENVSLRTTRVRDVHGTVWFVPNGEIKRVGNKSQLWARSVMDIEVAYDTDLPKAAAVIKEVADSVWRDNIEVATILEEPQIWGVENFGSSAIAIRLVIKTEPGEQFAAAREIRGRLKAAFDEAGIEIPFQQHTVWMQSEPTSSVPTGVLHAHKPSPDAAV